MSLSSREISLIQAAFSVGWFRALSEAEFTKVYSATKKEVEKECDDWLAENARHNHSLNISEHLDIKFTQK